jgi:hypothetical protein
LIQATKPHHKSKSSNFKITNQESTSQNPLQYKYTFTFLNLDIGNRKDYLKRSNKIEETIGFEALEVLN